MRLCVKRYKSTLNIDHLKEIHLFVLPRHWVSFFLYCFLSPISGGSLIGQELGSYLHTILNRYSRFVYIHCLTAEYVINIEAAVQMTVLPTASHVT